MKDRRGSNEPSSNDFMRDFEIDNDEVLNRYSSEPLIEVRDKGSEIDILIEANGSRTNDVVLERISSSSISLSLIYRGRKIRRKVTLPSRTRVGSYLINVRNGVARVKLLKRKS